MFLVILLKNKKIELSLILNNILGFWEDCLYFDNDNISIFLYTHTYI